MSILVSGGAGYIGSHTCVELLEAGYEIVVVDNLCNSCVESLNRVEQITGKKVVFYEADILDKEALNKIFDAHEIEAVIHFAGYKKPWHNPEINYAKTWWQYAHQINSNWEKEKRTLYSCTGNAIAHIDPSLGVKNNIKKFKNRILKCNQNEL